MLKRVVGGGGGLEAYEGYSKSHLDPNTWNKTSSSFVLFRYIYVLACK